MNIEWIPRLNVDDSVFIDFHPVFKKSKFVLTLWIMHYTSIKYISLFLLSSLFVIIAPLFQMIKMMVTVVVVFTICWLPFNTLLVRKSLLFVADFLKKNMWEKVGDYFQKKTINVLKASWQKLERQHLSFLNRKRNFQFNYFSNEMLFQKFNDWIELFCYIY